MTQTDMLVNVGIVASTTAGAVFFTCTEAGAAIGTAIFPGLGTAAGATIGFGIGVIGGVATGGYMWYVESARQENLLYEARQLAEWETENNRTRIKKAIANLQREAEEKRIEAWKGLLGNERKTFCRMSPPDPSTPPVQTTSDDIISTVVSMVYAIWNVLQK